MADIIDPSPHHWQTLAQLYSIAISHVKLPWNYAGGISPRGGDACFFIAAVSETVRHNSGDRAVRPLLQRHVIQPFVKKSLDIVVNGSRATEHLCVSGPAKALVTLRAIRRNIQIVAPLPPENIVIELVDICISAAKTASAIHIRIDGNRHKRGQIDGFQRILTQTNISEALKGISRLEYVVAATENIRHFIACGAIVFVIKISLAVQCFRMVQHNAPAARSTDAKFHITG